MTQYSNIHCNKCERKLTLKEASVYDLIWQHSGDMYCKRCRSCPDDCRKEPCRLKQAEADKIVARIMKKYQRECYQIDLTGNNLMRLQNTGVKNGVALWDHKYYVNERESYWRLHEWNGKYTLSWNDLKAIRPHHLYSEGAMKFLELRGIDVYSKVSGRHIWSDDEGLYAPYFNRRNNK